MPYAPDSYPRQIPQFKVHGRGDVTVSAKGIITGDSNVPNDGADFGPDTMLGATAPGQYGPPYSNTLGIIEAFTYGNNNFRNIQINSGIFDISSDINISLNVNVYGRFSNVPNGTVFKMVGNSTITLGLSGVVFSNIFVDGSESTLSESSTLVTISGASSCKISNCYFKGNASTPLTLLNIFGSQITLENSNISTGGGTNGSLHIGNSSQQSDVIFIINSEVDDFNNINIYAENTTRFFMCNDSVSDFVNTSANYELYLDGIRLFSIINTELGLRGSSTEYAVYMTNCSYGYINATVYSDGNPHGGVIYSGSGNANFYFIATFNNVNGYLVNENSNYNYGQLPEYIFTGYYNSTNPQYTLGSTVNIIPHIKLVSNPIQSATPSFPVSGSAIQNTNPFPVNVYVYGGDVTEIQITRNGTAYTVLSVSTAIAMSGQAYKLKPSDSITITYTSTPSWEWISD